MFKNFPFYALLIACSFTAIVGQTPTPGPNNFIDTVAQGDDWLAPVPVGQRPPGFNNSRTRKVYTGENGILETMPQGDDYMYFSTDAYLMEMYSPIPEVSNGQRNAVCIRSGPNGFLDTLVDPNRTDDFEDDDPDNPGLRVIRAGSNGRCDLRANNTNIAPPNVPNVSGVYDGTYTVVVHNILADQSWEVIGAATITIYGNPPPPLEPPPGPGECDPPPPGMPQLPCEPEIH